MKIAKATGITLLVLAIAILGVQPVAHAARLMIIDVVIPNGCGFGVEGFPKTALTGTEEFRDAVTEAAAAMQFLNTNGCVAHLTITQSPDQPA